MSAPRDLRRRNRLVLTTLALVAVGMVGMAYAAVPLYQLFCQVTGFGGTTQRAAAAPGEAGAKRITVRFNAQVNPKLPWSFAPREQAVSLRVGESRLAYYVAENRGEEPITGVSTFNVTPLKVGRYFNKIECFCFTEQTLAPGERVEMPVTFFVDPAIADDPNTREVSTITLSYTFFRALDDAGEAKEGGGAPAPADGPGVAKLGR